MFTDLWIWVCFVLWGFEANGEELEEGLVPAFKEFELGELRAATNGFSSELIVSESGEKAPNVVYKGKLRNNGLVAIKRFSKQSWPDPQQFVVIYFHFLYTLIPFFLCFSCWALSKSYM